MDLEDGENAARRIQLIAPGQIPRDGYSERFQTGKRPDRRVRGAARSSANLPADRSHGGRPRPDTAPRHSLRTGQLRQANG
jgi:hypothetical protein